MFCSGNGGHHDVVAIQINLEHLLVLHMHASVFLTPRFCGVTHVEPSASGPYKFLLAEQLSFCIGGKQVLSTIFISKLEINVAAGRKPRKC